MSNVLESWHHVLDGACYVINMDRCEQRWDLAQERIRNAGFTNFQRFKAVDAKNDSLTDAWKVHGSPKFDSKDEEFVTYPGKQGCMLSHLHLLKRMIEEKTPFATVFEDDVCFHARWHELAPRYFDSTPKDFDILYMGSQMDHWIDGHIIQTPVFCTHAFIITLNGAKKIYDLLLKDPSGVRTIDCMLIDHMKATVFRNIPCPFEWYVWNGLKFPDQQAMNDPHWAKRNTGLVFQDVYLGTDVRPWH